ncbi:hypothetical protein GCM10007147_29770 [Nocardiopsis kunsanensis]|uniref:Transposase putative helix-turn-helix domain-containing protein n=1 Tax=Nocardiopsis kunsanensis TaxID=141693 RepID=A0A918XF22_9ACTN|nr:helix-turn-helix domain-containing protein [Nocardiopsis kunsanensis]GHD29190.1 hypothetical protein GCM10007147_29770 [Nocardiopsis kunsanensis]
MPGQDQELAQARAGGAFRETSRPSGRAFSWFSCAYADPSRAVVRVQLRFAYRLCPDGLQRVALARLFGCVRVVHNDALERTRPVKAANKLPGSAKHRIAEGPGCPRAPSCPRR